MRQSPMHARCHTADNRERPAANSLRLHANDSKQYSLHAIRVLTDTAHSLCAAPTVSRKRMGASGKICARKWKTIAHSPAPLRCPVCYSL